jgi:BlaI family transcriptional regulator, penicillinase repressor
MARPSSKYPTELELEILKVMWEFGPATVREVHERIQAFRPLAYTSVMTVMKIMTEKRYLRREKEGVGHRYHAQLDQESTTSSMLGDLVERLFDGSAAAASVRLLETVELSEEELNALRALLQRKMKESES